MVVSHRVLRGTEFFDQKNSISVTPVRSSEAGVRHTNNGTYPHSKVWTIGLGDGFLA